MASEKEKRNALLLLTKAAVIGGVLALPSSRQYTESTHNRVMGVITANSTDTALEKLFRITKGTPELPEKNLYRGPGEYFTRKTETVKTGAGDVTVSLGAPDAGKLEAATVGIKLLKEGLPYYVDFFGHYPGPSIFVDSYSNMAVGQPGSIHIGGIKGGIDHRWLFYHELAHSYFHSYAFGSWFAEGAASFLPYIIIFEQMQNGQATWQDLGHTYGPGNEPPYDLKKYIEQRISGKDSPLLAQLKEYHTFTDTSLCKVESDYLAGSNLGELFFEQVFLHMGKQNFLNAMKTLYKKYRITTQKVTYQDMHDTFLFFTPNSKKAEVKQYLASKLCLDKSHRPQR